METHSPTDGGVRPQAPSSLAEAREKTINLSYKLSGAGPILYLDDVRLCGP
jgi:hypothetical protein